MIIFRALSGMKILESYHQGSLLLSYLIEDRDTDELLHPIMFYKKMTRISDYIT